MKNLFSTKLQRLRLLGWLEGFSLLILIFIAVPIKYISKEPALVKAVGPVHGILFLLFIINALGVGIEYKWQFKTTTWKVLLACIIPFGTFYVDKKILGKMQEAGSKDPAP